MDIERYRTQLKTIQRQLDARLHRETDQARAVEEDQADPGDSARADELRDEFFTLAQTDATTLTQVAEALERIDAGNFGLCAVDGEPIDEKRLKSVPWTAYCVKHQSEIEEAQGLKTPSL